MQGCKRAFLMTSLETAPLAKPLLDALGSRAVAFFDRIVGEPTIAVFEETLAAARAAQPDVILGLGGGSVLDTAKLVAALLDGRQQVREVFGIGLVTGRAVKVACLPTTSGTGSEVTPNSILVDEAEKIKKGVISPWLVPDAAFIDPNLMVTMPPAVTAFTGIDALCHCIEAYANLAAHPAVDVFALEGIRSIAGSLERAYCNGRDLEAREQMAIGSLYGGFCIGPVNTTAVHALAYPMGGEFRVPHGLSNAVLLPHVMRYNLDAAVDRYAAIALAMGAEPGGTPRELALRGIDRVAALCHAVGVDKGLGELGIPESALPHMAAAAITVTRLLKNNPRPVDLDGALGIYRNAYA
jgi:alcohol dehydrogenase class IV